MSVHTSETRRKLEWRSTSRAHLVPSTSAPTAVTVLAAETAWLPEFPAFEVFSALLFGVSVLQSRRFCCIFGTHGQNFKEFIYINQTTETGLEAIERLRFLASFPLPGTGKREEARKRNLSIASLPTPLQGVPSASAKFHQPRQKMGRQ